VIAADNGIFDFFSHSTWLVLRNLSVFIVCVFWLSIAYWVYKDARRRIEDPWLVGMATIIGLFPSARPSTWRTCVSASSR
jgi:hypothetical protein